MGGFGFDDTIVLALALFFLLVLTGLVVLAGWRLVVMAAGFVGLLGTLLVLAVLVWAYWQGSDVELRAWGERARIIGQNSYSLVWDILEAGDEETEEPDREGR